MNDEKYRFTTLFVLLGKDDQFMGTGIVYEDKCYIQMLYSVDGYIKGNTKDYFNIGTDKYQLFWKEDPSLEVVMFSGLLSGATFDMRG